MDELVMTPAGYEDLQAELDELKGTGRAEVRDRLRLALEAAGDLGDNLEYLDAVREQEALERRIELLATRLAQARVLRPAPAAKRLVLGSWAELEDLDTGEHSRYRLVGSPEANPSQGRLSIESPVGNAIAGHRAGETVDVVTPHGHRHLRIVAAGND